MYEALTSVYNERNAAANRENKEKIFSYTLLDKDFQKVQEGRCCNVSHRYDPCYDYNVVTFTDIDTGKTFSKCQFYVKLKEVIQ